MTFYEGFNLPDYAGFQSFIDSSLLAEGYIQEYTSGVAVGYKTQNLFVEESGSEAWFIPVFRFNPGEVVLSLATSSTSGSATDLTPEIDSPKLSGLTFPLSAFMVVTRDRLALSVFNVGLGAYQVLVAATVDYRYLNQANIGAVPAHLENLRNNNQCVFRVGQESSGIILYGGDPADQDIHNVVMSVSVVTTNPSPFRTPQDDSVPVSTAAVKSGTNRFAGLMFGVYLCDNTAFFNLDQGVDRLGNIYRFFRDQTTSKGLLVREVG